MASNNFDWAHPDFGVNMLGDNVTPQQRVRKYVTRAPKKTLRSKPRTNYGHYQWDNGMTFEEKARMLTHDNLLGTRVRKNAFIDDFDRYQSPVEQVMDYLRNAPANIQRYYGVYDDIMAMNKAPKTNYGPYNPKPSAPVRSRQRTGSSPAPRRTVQPVANVVVPPPTIEPEPLVDMTPLDVTDTTRRDWGQWNPTTAMASYQADAGLRRAAMAPVEPISVASHGWGGWLLPLCSY